MAENKEVVVQKSFQERLADRIKDDIGKLMTDKELASIVNKCVNQIFHDDRKVQQSGSYGGWEDAPPLVHVLLTELLEDKLRKATNDWLKEHNEEVLKVIEGVVERGLAVALIKTFEEKFSNEMHNFMSDIQQRLSQM